MLLLPGEGDRPALLLPTARELRRSFEEFDAPELSRTDAVDGALIETLSGRHDSAGVTTRRVAEAPTSALAPLYFLSPEARIPVAVIEITAGDAGGAVELGAWVASVARRLSRRVAIVAVGELSSRIFPGAPGGYEPDAAAFDRAVVEAVAKADLDGLRSIDLAQRSMADDALVPQLVAALATLPGGAPAEPPSYEHPFGVGYLVARLAPPRGAP